MPAYYSIHLPDHPDWWHESAYSRHITALLLAAFALIRAGGQQAQVYLQAFRLLQSHMDTPMSMHQRQRMFYVYALAHAAVSEHLDALFWLDETLYLEDLTRDTADLSDLYYLRGSINRALLRFAAAVVDHRICLALLHEERAAQGKSLAAPADTALEADILARLAGFEFFLARYEAARDHLREARQLSVGISERSLEAATIAWIHAHLDRWAGEPGHALPYALHAADVYTEQGNPASAARIQATAADILLDLAALIPAGTDRERAVLLARPHVQLAQSLAREAHDEGGVALVTLTSVRYSQMIGRRSGQEDPLAAIERVARTARRLGDDAILAQAFSSRGDLLAARGEQESARASYRDVLGLLDGSEVPALGRWAVRALLRAEEMDETDRTEEMDGMDGA